MGLPALCETRFKLPCRPAAVQGALKRQKGAAWPAVALRAAVRTAAAPAASEHFKADIRGAWQERPIGSVQLCGKLQPSRMPGRLRERARCALCRRMCPLAEGLSACRGAFIYAHCSVRLPVLPPVMHQRDPTRRRQQTPRSARTMNKALSVRNSWPVARLLAERHGLRAIGSRWRQCRSHRSEPVPPAAHPAVPGVPCPTRPAFLPWVPARRPACSWPAAWRWRRPAVVPTATAWRAWCARCRLGGSCVARATPPGVRASSPSPESWAAPVGRRRSGCLLEHAH